PAPPVRRGSPDAKWHGPERYTLTSRPRGPAPSRDCHSPDEGTRTSKPIAVLGGKAIPRHGGAGMPLGCPGVPAARGCLPAAETLAILSWIADGGSEQLTSRRAIQTKSLQCLRC